MKKLLFVFLLLCTALGFAGVKLEPVKSYTVVYPVKPTIQERYAARLLAEYLSKMTGTTIPAKREDRADEPVISVGNTELAKEAGFTKKLRLQGYAVDVKGKNVFIRGGHPGPLNCVISFMQEDLGFRYYAEPQPDIPAGNDPGEILIPDLSGKVLEVTVRSYTPPFESRELLYNYTHLSNPEALMFFRLAPLSYLSYLPKESGGIENSNLFVHTYYQLVPVKKYYDTHPEYFALQNGKPVICNMLMINDQLPSTKTQRFYTAEDNQDAVVISVYESRSTDEVMELEDRVALTDIDMRFTKKVPYNTAVDMTMALDNAGMLHIIAEEQQYHSKLDTTFQLSNQMTDDEMNSAALRMSSAKVE